MSIYAAASGHVSDEVLVNLRKAGTATAWAFLQQKGVRTPFMMGIQPLGEVSTMVGRARTLRYLPLREDLLPCVQDHRAVNPQRVAIESIEPGDVFVIDAGGRMDGAVLGDILTTRVKRRGAAGMVVDGVVRDSPFIKKIGMPVYTRGGLGHPAASLSRHLPWEHSGPVQCGGVTVLPGDAILGDEEGVLVIPAAYAADLAEWSIEHEHLETFLRQKIESGATIDEAYPPNEQVLAEYEAWKQSAR